MVSLRPSADDEWDNLPHVTMARNTPWSPHRYDSIEYMDDIAGPELRGLEDLPIIANQGVLRIEDFWVTIA